MKKSVLRFLIILFALLLLPACNSKKEYNRLFEEGYVPFTSKENNLTPENAVETFEKLGFTITSKEVSDETGETNITVIDDNDPAQGALVTILFRLYVGDDEPQFSAIIYYDGSNSKDVAYITETPKTQTEEHSGYFVHSFEENIYEKVASTDEQFRFLIK